ncbi:MAG: hypothetical protein KDA70_00535 [Planctomycetaceae bacterium]|nr:hypothetical protein [Planctomycetaceae bacterium]
MKNYVYRKWILHTHLPVLSVCLVLGCGLEQSDEQADPPIPVAPALTDSNRKNPKAVSSSGGETIIDGIQFQVPSSWEQVALSPAQQGMITASFRIPAAGKDVKLTLSSVGGGIAANLQRWKGQFQLKPGELPVEKTMRVDGVDAVWLDLRGTFDSGPAIDSLVASGMRMIGVAIPRSPRDFYLKLTGPREQLLNVEAEFQDFVKSGRFVQ